MEIILNIITQLINNKLYCPVITSFAVILIIFIIQKYIENKIRNFFNNFTKIITDISEIGKKLDKIIDNSSENRIFDTRIESKFDLIIGDLKDLKKMFMLHSDR